jgi:hypothetical protein
MKRKISIVFLFLILVFSSGLYADKLVFTEVGLSYGKTFSPAAFGNNSTGLFDTALFDAKVGLDFCKWADLYIGGAFDFFVDRGSTQNHYSFFPIFGGVAVNIMPDWVVYPSVIFEYGRAISNHHYLFKGYFKDNPWLADYYNCGFCVNWNMVDIAVLSFSVERPSISNMAGNGGEIHIIKTGLAWKIFY